MSRWVTTHGFALNLTNASDVYAVIVPCGIRDHGVTSVKELTGAGPDVAEAARLAFRAFADVFGLETGELSDESRGELGAGGNMASGAAGLERGDREGITVRAPRRAV